MRKLLIAESDEILCTAIVDILRRRYDITICTDGATALELLRTLRPDALILDLTLPVMDGFYILEQAADVRPPAILGICDFQNGYITQTASDLGVSYMVIKPCHPRVIAARLEHLVQHAGSQEHSDNQSRTARILLQFQFNPKNDGFRFLKIGIPLFAQDPHQRICKELYTAIAQICNVGSWNHVERSVRSAIETAFKTGAPAWADYFPGAQTPPTGKTFISRISQILMDS